VQGGKDGLLRLLNLDNLSGQGKIGQTGGEIGQPIPVPQGGGVFATPAVWQNPADGSTWVFVTTGSGISGLQLVTDGSGTPSLQVRWQNGTGGTSPVVANGIVFYVGGSGLRALDPTTGKALWSQALNAGIHWESPIVVNGTLYVTDENAQLTAFAPPAPVPGNLNKALWLPLVLR
jgi:hypothetical protein